MSELTDTLLCLNSDQEIFSMESEHTQGIECFTILMYSKGYRAGSVNEAWLQAPWSWTP